ncbi:D-glycero-beta-D-manno-heptose 1-phosphate adenylyltransferase [bacterium]|nr:MAG: D-glycero-beta-D-manno-heptose 1-phosphate adenylyltransferase [bacterium]
MRTGRTGSLLDTKIKKPQALKRIISRLKTKGSKIVFTNGCFDLLHYGHIRYLEDAKSKGDILIVAINSDSSIKKIKGKKRPLVKQTDRARIIAGLRSVDFVTIFYQSTPIKIIKLLRPDILVKGSDWKKDKIVGGEFAASYGGKVLNIRLIKGRSTTNLINKIAKLF